MDTITLHDLEIWTHIGVPDEERAAEQCVLVTVSFALDTKKAAKADDVFLSVDYETVARHIRNLAGKERRTIERFAEDIAEDLLFAFPAKNVTVQVRKKTIPGSAGASVTIERS